MTQFLNQTDSAIVCQIETGKPDVKIVPGEIVESRMNESYLESLGLKKFETKAAKTKEKKEPETALEAPKNTEKKEPETAPEAPKN